MSLVQLRVELPAYSRSFTVQVPISSSILDVKREIFHTCVGAPRAEGQRIICRGRYLVDHEKVQDIWKSPDEPRIVHLAVHPSAWSASPPEIPPASLPSPPPSYIAQRTQMPHQPVPVAQPQPRTEPPANQPLAFVLFKHQNALSALMHGRIVHASGSDDIASSRALAVQVVERNGWSWPAILDEEFPAASDGGLKYDRLNAGGQAYLSLSNPGEKPTPLQIHALKVLTFTFPLLSLPITNPVVTRVIPSQQIPIPPNVNMLLQQLGLPQLRVAQNQAPNQNGVLPDLREIPLRPFLAPILMLVFRTLILLYFVAPARKPVFAILLLAWLIYEGWRPIRNGLLRGWRRGMEDDQQRRNGPAAPEPNVEQNGQPGAGAPPGLGAGGLAANRIDTQAAAVLDSLANINIQAEDQALTPPPGTTPEEPGLGHKVATFLSLLAMTIHPAAWNRRRVALRQREGRIKTEANARQSQPRSDDAEAESRAFNERRAELVAQHAQRPRWVQNYVQRVIAGDWVDDSD